MGQNMHFENNNLHELQSKRIRAIMAGYFAIVAGLFYLAYWMVDGGREAIFLSVPIVCILPSLVLLHFVKQMKNIVKSGETNWSAILKYGIPFSSNNMFINERDPNSWMYNVADPRNPAYEDDSLRDNSLDDFREQYRNNPW